MFKLLIVSLFLGLSLFANETTPEVITPEESVISTENLLHDKIKNLIGEQEYTTHKNLINFIFKNKQNYQYNESLNFISIIKKLQENGLLKLGFDTPQEMLIEFQINNNPMKSLKILKDTLKSLGYYYYFTKNTQYDGNNNLIWTIKLKTEAAIDPLVLSNELLKKDCRMVDISKEGNKWSYAIDTNFANLKDASYVTNNERVTLKKPLKPYFIKVDPAASLYVASRVLNKWFPNIVFYDKHLNILKVVNEDKVHRNIKIPMPQNTKYIKISDLYTLINIKRGLSVIIKE